MKIRATCTAFVLRVLQLALLTVFVLAGKVVAAETRTWTGNGTNGNWSNPDNWDNGVPQNGDDVVMAGSNRLLTNQDIGNLTIRSLRFATTPNRTIDGNAIRFTGAASIVNDGMGGHDIKTELILDGATLTLSGEGSGHIMITNVISELLPPAPASAIVVDSGPNVSYIDLPPLYVPPAMRVCA